MCVVMTVGGVFVSGQLEPLQAVPRPTKGISKIQEKIFRLSLAR